jgi:hypothetical protein
MKPEQQRIAIAEACGLTNVAPMIVKNVKHQGDDITVGIWSDDGWVPNYLNDLNAMHEAEKVMTDEQDLEYSKALEQVVEGRFVTNNAEDMRRLRSATASQRAEAFLRTIGKCEEAK